MKVFISYGSAADQVTALRLQALAVVNGLTVYVPPAYTRAASSTPLGPEVGQKLVEAEIILGVVGTGLTDACRQELDRGIALHKTTIVMADPAFEQQLEPYFGPNLVVIDPAHPDHAELKIVEYLKAIDAEQNTKTALLALGTLALGLLIFAPTE
jgi:hypothetical protein